MGLGGRSFGTVITLVPVGRRSLYRLHLYRRASADVRAGASGFSPCPTPPLMYPLLFMAFPKLWSVAKSPRLHHRGRFCARRFGNRWLALAIA